MGFLRCVDNSTDSYVVVFFLAVEKVFPPEKTVLAGASHRTNSPYLFLFRTNFPRVPSGRGSRVGTRIPTQGSLFPRDESLKGQTSRFYRTDTQIKKIEMVCEGKTFAHHPMHICVSVFSKEITA
jgi:hypothetical protein